MTEMETEEHLKKMEEALNHIIDPAVKEYLQLLKLQQSLIGKLYKGISDRLFAEMRKELEK